MAVAHIIFALDLVNTYFFNAVFTTKILELHGSISFIGISGSCNALLSFLWKPIAGSLSDKLGTSKLLTWCLFSNLVTAILTYTSQSLGYVVLCRIFLAFSSPNQVLLRTIITNTSSEKQSENLAKLGIVAAVSIIGAALASGPLLSSPTGIKCVYGILVINALTNLVLTQFLPSSEAPRKQDESSASNVITSSLKNLKKLSTCENYWDIFLSKALVALSFGMVDANSVLVFGVKGIENKYFGYVVTTVFSTMFIANIVQERINRIFYKNDVGYQRILHASIFIVLSFLAQGFSTEIWIYVLSINITAFFRNMVDNSMMEILLKKVNVEEKAMVLSSFDSVQSLTDLLAPLLGGILLEFLGIPSLYLFSAILFGIKISVVDRRKIITNVISDVKKEN